MTIGINTSPLAGQGEGDKLTARQFKDPLSGVVGNVSIRVLPTDLLISWRFRTAATGAGHPREQMRA